MKNNILFLLLACSFSACFEEDERGQYAIEHVPPGAPLSPEVENLPGAAIIRYNLPDDEDLLYVKAVYTLDNGVEVEQKASGYVNQVMIEGIGKSREVEVKLIAGDRSKNESEPITVVAHPLDAPIYDVFKTAQVAADFGGVRVKWQNIYESEIVVTVTTTDEFGDVVVAGNFYSNAKDGEGTIRGYESVERMFGVSFRDRWGNLTDTLDGTFLPLYEQRIEPKDKFTRWNPVDMPYKQYSAAFSIEKLWDEDPVTRYLFNSIPPTSFTFDMGQTATFSRFHAFMAPAQMFVGQAVESFEIWGSPSPDVNSDFASGWIKIGEYRFTRPSENGGTAQDDEAAGLAGEEFNVEPGAPPVRYIRFVVTKNWGNGVYNTLGELKFWGEIQ